MTFFYTQILLHGHFKQEKKSSICESATFLPKDNEKLQLGHVIQQESQALNIYRISLINVLP